MGIGLVRYVEGREGVYFSYRLLIGGQRVQTLPAAWVTEADIVQARAETVVAKVASNGARRARLLVERSMLDREWRLGLWDSYNCMTAVGWRSCGCGVDLGFLCL